MQILATDEEGTRSALSEAKRLVRAGSGRVVVVVPQVLSYFSEPADPSETCAITDKYRALASSAGVDALVRVCVCRRLDDAFMWMIKRQSRVVIGGRARWWWPTAVQRTVRRLSQSGYDVVFAPIGAAR